MVVVYAGSFVYSRREALLLLIQLTSLCIQILMIFVFTASIWLSEMRMHDYWYYKCLRALNNNNIDECRKRNLAMSSKRKENMYL